MVALREREITHEQNTENPAVHLVVLDKKRRKVLLVRHTNQRKEGMVGFPGGRPINGSSESLIDAGVRELREETGLRTIPDNVLSFSNNTFLGLIKRERGDKYYAFKAFIVEDFDGELKRRSPEGKVFWADISKLDRYGQRLSPTVKTVLSESLNFLNNQ